MHRHRYTHEPIKLSTALKDTLAAAGWIPQVEGRGGRAIVPGFHPYANPKELGKGWFANPNKVSPGTSVLKNVAKAKGGIPHDVVIALGTNGFGDAGSFVAKEINYVMSLLGPKRNVYWVNVWVDVPKAVANCNRLSAKYYMVTNNEISKAATRFKNLHVIDWNSFVNSHKKLMVTDYSGYHYVKKGYELRAMFIRDQLRY